MPAVPGYKDQQFRLAREASYGVAPVGGWRRTGSLTLDLQPKIDTDQFTASGDAVPSLSVLNDDSADGSLKGKADYEFTQYPMSSFFGDAVITVPGGGTVSRQWDWAWNGTDTILPASFAVQVGTPAVAEQALGAIFSGWTLKGGRKGMDLTAKLFAKKVTQGAALGGATSEVQTVTVDGAPTGGTFTLSYKGATTATIAYNAAASAVQAALEALPTVQAGQVVAAGGPLPGASVTVTFAGLFAGRDVPLITAAGSFTGGTLPAVAVTATTPGADAETNIASKPMGPLDLTL